MLTPYIFLMKSGSRSLIAALAASTIISAAPAVAQIYYARQPLTGLRNRPTYYYTPTYSSIYGACASGIQIAPIASCTRSDGKVVSNALCGTEKQTTSRACAARLTCSSLNPNAWPDGKLIYIGTASHPWQAQTMCQSHPELGAGLCGWNESNNLVVYSTSLAIYHSPQASVHAGKCTMS